MSTLRRLLDVRPEERRNTFAAFGALLGITTGHTVLETARDAIFLSKLPASELPWMYLMIAVLALGLTRLRKADSKRAIVAVLVVAAVVTAGFWTLRHDLSKQHWILYALYVWSGLFASWVTVQFWTLLGRAHTMTQAKRLYGFIGAGAVLGGVVGAFGARAALTVMPPRTMLLASAILFLVSAAPVMAVRVPAPAERVPVRRVEDESSMTTGVSLLWQNPFARRILGIAFASTVAVTLADFLFKARVAHAFTDTRSLAAWLSTFYAVTNTISLVAQLFIGPWIFRTLGVQRALFLFPILLVLSSGGVIATGGLLASAVVLKGLDGALRYSVHKTSTELLLVPVPDGTRERIKPIIELVGTRGGQAAASLAILALVALGIAGTSTVAILVLVLAVVWAGVVVSIRAHYLDVFRETLRAGGLSGKAELPELDLGALEMLFAGLNSSRDMDVLGSLELLAEQKRQRLIPALILYHPSRAVVLRALELFTVQGRTDFVSIADRLNDHPDREVAAAALRARTAVAPDRQLLEERLGDSCSLVGVTALVALMARGWIALDDADARVKAIFAARSWHTAAELARAIRDIAADPAAESRDVTERFDEILIRLAREAAQFHDDEDDARRALRPAPALGLWGTIDLAADVRIRLEVARAMAARRKPAYLAVLVGMLGRHELRARAREAISEIPGALELLDEVLRQHELAREVRVHVPRTMVLFEPKTASKMLLGHLLTERDGAVRFKILRALVKLRRANPELPLDETALQRVADRTLEKAAELRRWGNGLATGNDENGPGSGLGPDPLRAAHHLLLDLVRDKEAHATQRLFMLFELLYGEDFEPIERGLKSRQPKKRASSLELLENIVLPPLRDGVLELVGEAERLAEAAAQPPGYDETLREILAKGSTTMRTLAEYRAHELGLEVPSTDGRRLSQPPSMESIGRRLVDQARDLLNGEVASPKSHAPA